MSSVLLASSPQDGIRDASTWVLKTPLGNTRRPLRALVENYARSASVYERARAREERSSRVREEKRVSWLDSRKDKRAMTGISEVYIGAKRTRIFLARSFSLSFETAPFCTRLLDEYPRILTLNTPIFRVIFTSATRDSVRKNIRKFSGPIRPFPRLSFPLFDGLKGL